MYLASIARKSANRRQPASRPLLPRPRMKAREGIAATKGVGTTLDPSLALALARARAMKAVTEATALAVRQLAARAAAGAVLERTTTTAAVAAAVVAKIQETARRRRTTTKGRSRETLRWVVLCLVERRHAAIQPQ